MIIPILSVVYAIATARETLQIKFLNGVISQRRDIDWSPRSSDLTSLDFFSMGLSCQQTSYDFRDAIGIVTAKSVLKGGSSKSRIFSIYPVFNKIVELLRKYYYNVIFYAMFVY